jgi:hypothetical protein
MDRIAYIAGLITVALAITLILLGLAVMSA